MEKGNEVAAGGPQVTQAAGQTQTRPRPEIARETNRDGTPLPYSPAGNELRRRADLTDDKADMVSGEADRLDSEGRLPDVAADLRQNVEDLRRDADRLRDEGYENDRNEAARAGFWDPEGLNRGPDGVDRPPPRPGR